MLKKKKVRRAAGRTLAWVASEALGAPRRATRPHGVHAICAPRRARMRALPAALPPRAAAAGGAQAARSGAAALHAHC